MLKLGGIPKLIFPRLLNEFDNMFIKYGFSFVVCCTPSINLLDQATLMTLGSLKTKTQPHFIAPILDLLNTVLPLPTLILILGQV